MNSRKTLVAILGGVALATAVGILLTPYRDSSTRKKIVKKAKDYTDSVGEKMKESVANGNSRFEKMGEEVDRMINEGGSAVYKS